MRSSLIYIHPFAQVDDSAEIGQETKVWQFATIRDHVVIGENCAFGPCSFVGTKTKIGNNVRVQHGAHITDHSVVEDDVFIGNGVMTTNDKYPRSLNPTFIREPVLLKKGCSIGAGTVILPGITVGEYAMVGAGSVVTRDVPAHVTVYGNPARVAC